MDIITRRQELESFTLLSQFKKVFYNLSTLQFSHFEKDNLIEEILFFEDHILMNYIDYEERREELSNMKLKELIPIVNQIFFFHILEEGIETMIDIILELEEEHLDEGFCE